MGTAVATTSTSATPRPCDATLCPARRSVSLPLDARASCAVARKLRMSRRSRSCRDERGIVALCPCRPGYRGECDKRIARDVTVRDGVDKSFPCTVCLQPCAQRRIALVPLPHKKRKFYIRIQV